MESLKRKCLRLLAALSLLFTTFSCEVLTDGILPEPQTEVYTIRRGMHASGAHMKVTYTGHKRFDITFDKSAAYTTRNPQNQGDINKLFGFSDCGSQHQVNSARFGWRWYKNNLEIHAYTYQNKVRSAVYIGNVVIGKASRFELRVDKASYVFILDGKRVILPRACSGIPAGYLLYPYFGGDEPAPHDIHIKFRRL